MKTRDVDVGGLDGPELLAALEQAGVQLNELGLALLSSRAFDVIPARRSLVTVEVSVGDLGLSLGATITSIYQTAGTSGLSLCPIDLGPHLRLQYLDQPEGAVGQPTYQRRAPPGSITIASAWSDDGDDSPKGFYLRRIDGTLWLRGFCSDSEHVWDRDDRFVFRKA